MSEEQQRVALTPAEQSAALRLEEFLPYRLMVCANLVSASLSRIYANHKISISEWYVLLTLGQFQRMTGRDIGSRCHMHKTKVSRAVSALDARGWIIRTSNSRDRREAWLTLTPLGNAVYVDLAPRALEFMLHLAGSLADTDRATLDLAMQKLSDRSVELAPEAKRHALSLHRNSGSSTTAR